MPVTINQLKALREGDAIYFLSRKYTVYANDGYTLSVRTERSRFLHRLVIADYTARATNKIVPREKTRNTTTRKPTTYAHAQTDGGRNASGFTHEKNDCTVLALVEALEVPYAIAHAHMKLHGRRDRGVAFTHQAYADASRMTLGGRTLNRVYESSHQPGSKRTLAAWLKTGNLPQRCIVRINRHVFAVVDGVVKDSFKPGPRSRVLTIWEVK